MNSPTMVQALRAWAADAAEFARVLATQDPSWGSEAFELAGGQVALCGPGMYVNRAMAIGIDGPLTADEWAHLEQRSATVGVNPAVEINPATHPAVTVALGQRGYELASTTSALRLPVNTVEALAPLDPALTIEGANSHLLETWQQTSVVGWGHESVSAIRTSDAFSRAAAVVNGEQLLLVCDTSDGHPVACASLTMRAGVATLGAMSTIPSHRGRGIQAALIGHRARSAVAAGCHLITTSTKPGGVSERNLIRHGFEPWFSIDTYELQQVR